MRFKTVTLGVLFAAGAAHAQAPAAASDALLGPMAGDLRNRIGHWCVEARLQLTPQARPVTVRAAVESRLIGGRWLVTEMRGPGFEGVGLNGYDPATRRYTGYWADGTRGFTVPVDGEYDSAARIFRTHSVERRANGESVVVHSETRRDGPDGEVTTFTTTDAQGRPYERMVMRYRRARQGTDCLAGNPRM
ncbi:MAG TPA: DUF1579 family protein [Allosphingosinicella sp.]|nr:DUF1579 family protein [Allosphingosinicella sp.]